MDHMIILRADELVVCPRCAHEFTLGEGITRQTIDRHAEEFEGLLQQRKVELEAHLRQEAQRVAAQASAAEVARLQQQVAAARKAEQEALADIDRARHEARDDRLAQNMTSVVGDLQGIAQDSLPALQQIATLESLALPEPEPPASH